MNRIRSRFVKASSMGSAPLTAVVSVSDGAAAKEHKVKGKDPTSRPMWSPTFSSVGYRRRHGNAEKREDEYYLYVQHSQDQGIRLTISRLLNRKPSETEPD